MAVHTRASSLQVIVADGAGNSGRGARGADLAVAAFEGVPLDRLVALDAQLAGLGAEAAVVLAEIELRAQGLHLNAACAGDVRVWALFGPEWHSLTDRVPRKPLVGSGARPVVLRARGVEAVLVASDGLARWSGPELEPLALHDPTRALDGLLTVARDRIGQLGDDVSIVLVTRA